MVQDYHVESDETGTYLKIRGNFPNDVIGLNMKEGTPGRQELIDIFLNRDDIRDAINYIACISIDKAFLVNKSLFISALSSLMKCFMNNASREKLKAEEVFLDNHEIRLEFEYFKNMRHKHFLHDENAMLETTSFFLYSDSYDPPLFQASVVWNKAPIEFYTEGLRLRNLLIFVFDYLNSEIAKITAKILDDHSSWTLEDLKKAGNIRLKRATIEDIDKPRNQKTPD